MTPVKCAGCGALIDPLALTCQYCRLTTPAGVAAHQRAQAEAQQRAHLEAQARFAQQATAQQQMKSASTQALLCSILGTLLCCFPVGIVGIVLGVRARSLASRLGAPPPARATLALALGILSSVLSVAVLAYGFIQSGIDEENAKHRIATLEQELGAGPSRNELDRSTACGLAELHALRTGWDGRRGHSLAGFECLGKVRRSGDRAELDDFRFHPSTDTKRRFEVRVCFKRGAVWYVSEMREGACLAED